MTVRVQIELSDEEDKIVRFTESNTTRKQRGCYQINYRITSPKEYKEKNKTSWLKSYSATKA